MTKLGDTKRKDSRVLDRLIHRPTGLPELVGREGVDVGARLERQRPGDELDVVPLNVGDDHDAHLRGAANEPSRGHMKTVAEAQNHDIANTARQTQQHLASSITLYYLGGSAT